MRIVFICQAVDAHDPVLGHLPSWIEHFRRAPGITALSVITLRQGAHSLPGDIRVNVLSRGSLARLVSFYRLVAPLLRSQEPLSFFVCQGGPYPLMLRPLTVFSGHPIYQWKAHTAISALTWVSARWCDRAVFTPTAASFPVRGVRVLTTGHGIDTELFRPGEIAPATRMDLVSVGRISEVKRVPEMLRLLQRYRELYGECPTLSLYGPVEGDYRKELESEVASRGLTGLVSFHSPLQRDEVPSLLRQARAMLFFCRGALGKAALEAMACGVPVLSDNTALAGILSPPLRRSCIVPSEDTTTQAHTLHALLHAPEDESRALGAQLREIVVRDHNLKHLFNHIADFICAEASRD